MNPVSSVAFLIVALLFTAARPTSLSASCWASNPDGVRICNFFVGKYGLTRRLCEDKPGDCAKVGYKLNQEATSADKAIRKKTNAKDKTGSASPTDDIGLDAPEAGSRSDESGASYTDSGDGFQALLVVGAVIGAVILIGRIFGLDAGTSIFAAVVGFVLGVFSGLNRRNRW